MRLRYRDETVRMIRSLTRYRYNSDGTMCLRYNQTQLASFLHLTISQMSRVSTGVCLLSGPAYIVLTDIYNESVLSL